MTFICQLERREVQMINLIEDIKETISDIVGQALSKAMAKGELPEIQLPEVFVETPREKGHGDFSSNIAMQLTKLLRMPPVKIADIIINNIKLKLILKVLISKMWRKQVLVLSISIFIINGYIPV